MTEDARLDELDKQEWRDVAKKVRPDLTDEEFEKMWEEFHREKALRQAH